jgi:ABC-2 type transport system permease protein
MKHFALLRQIRVGIVDALTIWRYELRNVIRDQGVFIFFVLVPLGYPLLYSFIYTQETVRNVPVTVVDCSHSKLSREFVRKIDASPDLQVKSYCADMEEAKQMMRDKAVYGIVYIPEDFSRNLNEGKQAIITAMSDMSGLLYYKAVLATCTDVSLEMNENIQLQTLGATTKEQELQSTEPIPYDNVAMFNPTNGFATFLIPAVLMLIIQQTLLIGVGMSNGTARETNRWGDLLPVLRHYNGTFRIVMGKSLCYLMIYAITATWIAVCVPKIFGLTQIPQPKALLGFLFPYVVDCIFFAMTCSVFIRNRETCMIVFVFTSLPLLFISGISWPRAAIPEFWQVVSWLFPSTFGINGFVRINTMGALLEDVQPEYQALWIQTGIYFITTCIVYRWQILRSRLHVRDAYRRKKALQRIIEEGSRK